MCQVFDYYVKTGENGGFVHWEDAVLPFNKPITASVRDVYIHTRETEVMP